MSAVDLSYRDEVVSVLRGLHSISELSSTRLGIAGSVARGDANKRSDIDVVVDTDDLSLSSIDLIKGAFAGRVVDVLCLGLLEKEDLELDSLMLSMGLPINDDSVYKTVVREVFWVD